MARQSHSYNSGRIHRAGSKNPAATRSGKPKKRRLGLKISALLLVMLIAGVSVYGVYMYNTVQNALDEGATGAVAPEHFTPEEYQGDVINILVVGIYREEKDPYPPGLGLTDMILYINYDLKNNKMNILQIPRDVYPGEGVNTGGSGKINAAMVHGEDKDNPINNLVNVISTQYGLPIDRYICIDMEGLKDIVDVFDALYVYVPQRLVSPKGHVMEEGWQWLDGESVEYFVRHRSGTGFERADIDRLDNQRHFYAALFRRFLNLSYSDLVKLIPVFEYRCFTDFGMGDLLKLATSGLNLQAEDVMFCKLPGATRVKGSWEADPTGLERDIFVVDLYGHGEEPGAAELLNTYFRTYGEPLSADDLIARGCPYVSIPDTVSTYSPNIQVMGEIIESEEGGADVNVEPGQY